MNPERIQLGIDVLAKLPKNYKFDMSTWGTHLGVNHSPSEANYCGTHACAWGWIALDPRVHELGVKTSWRSLSLEIKFGKAPRNQNSNFHAAMRFFEIDEDEATWLFTSDTYPGDRSVTRGMVIRRMRAFLKSGKLSRQALSVVTRSDDL